MAKNAPDIVINAKQNPAKINAHPFETFDVFDKDNNLVAHMESAAEGTQPHLISLPDALYPLTVKFKQHDAPAVESGVVFPAGIEELN